MSDLLAEVDEAMRQEKLFKFWQDNGKFIIGIIALTIIATGALSAYRGWDRGVRISQTDKLLEMTYGAGYPENLLNVELDIKPDLRAIAFSNAAKVFLRQDKIAEAKTMLEKVAKDKDISPAYRDNAVLTLTRLDMDTEKPNADSILKQLEAIIDSDSPWAAQALVQAAVIDADLKNNYKTAQQRLDKVTSTSDLPPSLYQRAQQLKHVYAMRETQQTQTSQ
ncbi:MAG: hypothetical protein ACPGRX_01770 [Bdellovibrionales bacterium]